MLGGGFGGGLKAPNIKKLLIHSVLFLYTICGIQEFVGEKGEGEEEHVEDNCG